MTILHSSLEAETGLAQRAAVTQQWRSAPSETQALWQSAFDAAAGGCATERSVGATAVAADVRTLTVNKPSSTPLATTRVDSVITPISIDAGDSPDKLVQMRDRCLTSVNAIAGVAPREAVTRHWRSAAPEPQAPWPPGLVAEQGVGAADLPLDSTSAPVEARARSIATPSPMPLATMPVKGVAAANSTEGQDFRDELGLMRDECLAATGLVTLTAPLAADTGAVTVASASLMDGFTTFIASPDAARSSGVSGPTDRAAPPKSPLASTTSAAVMVALAPSPFQMAPPRINVQVATHVPARGAAHLASNLQPAAKEHSGVRRQQTWTEAQADLQEESVLVLQREHGIEIVVRHAALAPQAAVSCALATAQHLVGDRKALQQVTLNGRTVYDNPSQPMLAEPMRPQRSLLFSC
jgi:hypothetical protein